jgi:hypothetical protein
MLENMNFLIFVLFTALPVYNSRQRYTAGVEVFWKSSTDELYSWLKWIRNRENDADPAGSPSGWIRTDPS